MNIKKTKFKGLLIIKQKNNKDNRGNLRETFNNKILNKMKNEVWQHFKADIKIKPAPMHFLRGALSLKILT